MDFESDLCFSKSYTDNMADFKAPTNTINDTSAAPATTTTTTNNNIEHNFHELCRSCGKTNAELYDLFQTTNSPFSTSSTTCYTHLNNCPLTSSSTTSSSSLSAANKPSTSATFTDAAAAASTKATTAGITFDSLAATAKATAKGQSNMDNILQEMQIWQLLIKCNDGLPQRICAKCTAQFYMIHKFRRKCLKVQTQLRALYEEQQKFYERQQQQQQKEKNVTVKDATIEATSTPAPAPASSPATTTATAATAAVPQAAPLVEVFKPPVMHKLNDLVNDNYCEPQQAVVDNTNTKSSVPFEANTGNTNDFIAPSTTAATAKTLPDKVETMPQKTEANEPTPTSSAPAPAPAFIDKTFEAKTQEHCVVTTDLKHKDEKKPLLRPAVMDSKRSPPLTLQQSFQQTCDNDTTADHQWNASKKLCLDQELFLNTHIIFKSNNKQNDLKQHQKSYEDVDEELYKRATVQVITNTSSTSSSFSPVLAKSNESLKPRLLSEELTNLPTDCALTKANSESLFVTKAALKAYSIHPPPPPTSETQNRDHQKPLTNSEAIELKNTNDNNNNTHGNIYFHRCDNRSTVLNDNTCSSTSNSTPSSSCSSRYQKRKNITRRRIIKYANRHNRRPGHCYKSNGKAATATATATAAATTKMARTILSYGGRMVVAKKRKQRSQQDNKHKLKRRLTQTETSSTFSKTVRGIHHQQQQQQQQQHQQNIQLYHKKSTQMEDEMSSTVSTTSSASTTSSSTSSTSPSSAISSTSSHLKRATTPAATDLVRNCAGVTSFCRNANENMNKKGCSSADRLSSNDSSACIMWKTKAAMKANGNDMPVVVEVAANNNGEPTGNVPQISLPYIAPATLTGSTPSSLWSASSATEKAKSSKTLYENQSINSCLKNNNNNNNNVTLAEEYHTHNKIIMSSPDNQVKDTKNKGTFLQTTKILNRNLWPEEAADQQQINTNTNNNQSDSEKIALPIVAGNTQTIRCVNSEIHDEMESPQIVDELQKPTTPPTHPTRSGSMKLIIQRKRGARFKCLRKYEDDGTPDTPGNHKPSKPKRKRKHEPHDKLEMVSLPSLDADCADKECEDPISFENVMPDKTADNVKVPGFNTAEDENKENPIPVTNNYEFDSDSNVSVYRDPLLLRNELLDEDTPVTDFSKMPLSLQTECTKDMYKQYKEKANLDSPKKLLVRVPLTSLTQDFKRLHLTMDDQENETANEEASPPGINAQESNKETLCIEQQKDLPAQQGSSPQVNASSSQSDLLGFSQCTASSSGTADSFHPSIDIVKYIDSPLCPASSKINDFINDFQNNCIDSSEIEDSCDMIPTLGRCITQGLSDEIRDVEDTLNGIISEMHDKDMYTPSSGKREELFPHSVYSPLTESATTPSQSFYAESPCTINSNPMSVSPFIHHNMDYNAMTPQSNHSSMGYSSSYMSGGGSTGPHTGVYSSEHFPTYNECFEESNQSELIGFQNDIPCFENIDMAANELQAESNELDEGANATDNSACVDSKPEVEAPTEPVSYVDLSECSESPDEFPAPQPATLTETSDPIPGIQPQQISYNLPSYQQLSNTPPFQMQNINTPFIPTTTASRPHYFVTNTNQGSILITSPQLNQARNRIETTFKPHSNNLQFVTLGQALKANQTQPNPLINNTTNKISWPTTVNAAPNFTQQPVLPTANGTTTYFINTNNGLYQANIPTTTIQSRPVNTIFVPPNTSQTFCKTNIGNSRTAIQQQPVASNPSSQYIMLVNNLNGSSQYYAAAPTNLNQTPSPQPNIQTPTVLIHPVQSQNVQNTTNYASSQQSNTESTTSSAHIPLPTPLEPQTDAADDSPPELPKFNQQLQKHLKRRQQLLPRTSNVTQNITLICRFCHKRPKFTNNVDYSNHIINTHPAEKPYNCPHCPTHFSRRSDRQTHVAHFHGSRYQCAQCGLSFCAQRTLDFHLQKYHGNLGRSHQHLQQNSSSATTKTMGTTSATTPPATYQLLQHNHQQRLVRVEDVHVQVTAENKNKRSINLTLNGDGDGDVDTDTSQSQNEVQTLSRTVGTQQVQQQQQQQHQQQQRSRKLCCPDCNSDNDNCNFLNQNDDQNDSNSNTTQAEALNAQQYAGNESVNNHTVQHVTIPSPEQTEPDSTTTLRHFRRRQLCENPTHFALASPSSSSSSFHNNTGNNDGGHDNINLNHNSPDNALNGDGGGEQIVVERTLRDSHNCMQCEESFTNEIALRKHHHLAHGAATQSTTCSSANASTSLVCSICKQTFRMRNTLQRHMETHDAEGRPYECNICSVRFPRPSQLTLHKLTVHKFEKPNSCEECGKQFGTESGMKSHVTEHKEATRETNTLASEASTSSSQSQLSSHIYSDTLKANTTTTTTTTTSASTIQEENINIQATASGENSSASALINDDTDACNNTIVSGLVVT